MKQHPILFLLPPSEGKKTGGTPENTQTTFHFMYPFEIACEASEKDLKCSWKRYLEALKLHHTIETWPVLSAIERYSWVMFKHIDYSSLPETAKDAFNHHVLISSWMWWLLSPRDLIPNYKLPITSRWLYSFRSTTLSETLLSYCQKNKIATVIDIMSGPYKRLFHSSNFIHHGINWMEVNFLHEKNWVIKKMTHWVKWVKWRWLREIMLSQQFNYAERNSTFEDTTIEISELANDT